MQQSKAVMKTTGNIDVCKSFLSTPLSIELHVLGGGGHEESPAAACIIGIKPTEVLLLSDASLSQNLWPW